MVDRISNFPVGVSNPGAPSGRSPPFCHFRYSIIGVGSLTQPPASLISSNV